MAVSVLRCIWGWWGDTFLLQVELLASQSHPRNPGSRGLRWEARMGCDVDPSKCREHLNVGLSVSA